MSNTISYNFLHTVYTVLTCTMKVCYGQHMWTRRCIISTQPIYSTYYSAIRAYSKKNGWKLASPAEDRNGGRAIGSLFGICGSVLRVLEDDCLDNGRDDDASPELDLDILKLSVYKWHIKWVTESLIPHCVPKKVALTNLSKFLQKYRTLFNYHLAA